jgi:hypothetical protein
MKTETSLVKSILRTIAILLLSKNELDGAAGFFLIAEIFCILEGFQIGTGKKQDY